MPEDDVDPRIARTRRVVLAAVLEELAEVGHSDFTIESVAARCGVGKSTIYRHWDGKTDLVLDAMRTMNIQPAPDVDGAPLARVRQLLEHLTAALADPVVGPSTVALIEAAERDARVRDLLHGYAADRRRGLVDAIAAAVEAGEVDEAVDPDLAAQALAGAIFHARLLTPSKPDAATLDALVATVLGTTGG